MYRSLHTRAIRRRDSDLWPGRFPAGTWAFILNRIAALGLVLFLVLHLLAVSTVLLGPEIFNRTMAFLHRFTVLEVALLAALLYHGLNGIRVILLDLGVGLRHQRLLFWAAFTLSLAGTVAGGWFLLVLKTGAGS